MPESSPQSCPSQATTRTRPEKAGEPLGAGGKGPQSPRPFLLEYVATRCSSSSPKKKKKNNLKPLTFSPAVPLASSTRFRAPPITVLSFSEPPAGSDAPETSIPQGGGEGRWRRPVAGEERGHGDPEELLDWSVMAASPHSLSSRLLTGIAPAVEHGSGKVLFCHVRHGSSCRLQPWEPLGRSAGHQWWDVTFGVARSDEGSELRSSPALWLWRSAPPPSRCLGGTGFVAAFGFH